MDKNQSKPKSKIMMKFLILKAAPAVSFHKPISPGKEKYRPVAGRGFSGPNKISIIPQEARSKSNKSGFETPESTSPKVSCIGQIKKKNKMKMKGLAVEISEMEKRYPPSLMKRILTGRLNQIMKRFSTSGRGALANFDWTAQVAPTDDVEGEETDCGGSVWPLQPRKELNIWKRRTVVPPTPLQL